MFTPLLAHSRSAFSFIASAVLACVLAFAAPALAADGGLSVSSATDVAGSASDAAAMDLAANPVANEIIRFAQSQTDEAVRVAEQAHKDRVVKKATKRAIAEGSATDYFIAVDIPAKRTMIFKWKGDEWKLVKYWVCSTGAPESPTITGTFEVGDRGYSFGDEEGYTCYYWTQFSGNYLFHSIKYEPGTFDVQDGRLGEDVSEGCVRLKIKNAKWIYDTIPWSTKVVVYD
ncbi:MAG: L,D-transpeptidase [Coriobacteriia bacterium]|nr:L,D-transpeptidase [Coriobacteriia bacterium]